MVCPRIEHIRFRRIWETSHFIRKIPISIVQAFRTGVEVLIFYFFFFFFFFSFFPFFPSLFFSGWYGLLQVFWPVLAVGLIGGMTFETNI